MGRKKDTFWQYVDIVEKNKVKCKFCGDEFAGGATRIKGHLSRIQRKGIKVCRKVPENVKTAAASTYDDFERDTPSRVLGSSSFQFDSPLDVQTDSLKETLVNLDSPSGASREQEIPDFPVSQLQSRGETEVMEEMNDINGTGGVIFPGFRFHPTDMELVFYLRRKIQHNSFPENIIKQLDIYKYEPWELRILAAQGETEWWFCCPMDQNYRNAENKNRVTKNGYWKATGKDRPIFSERDRIGVKKLYKYYQGRVPEGITTDWIMQEFQLPPLSDSTSSPIDSWAICKIFRMTTFKTMMEDHRSMMYDINTHSANDTIEKGSASGTNFSAFHVPSYTLIDTVSTLSQIHTSNGDITNNFLDESLWEY